MSMPSFPEESLNITCDQAFRMLLGSIAMEELALSHILNAEGEKIQYVLGTLPGGTCARATPKEVLEVNRSVSDLLEKVAYNQILLKSQLRQVMEAKELCAPEEPPCPPQGLCGCVWTADRSRTWRGGCAIPWRPCTACAGQTCWQGCSPGQIHLCPRITCLASATLQIQAPEAGPVRAALQAGHPRQKLMALEGYAEAPGQEVFLSGCVVLTPVEGIPTPSPIQLVLETPGQLELERAVLTILPV